MRSITTPIAMIRAARQPRSAIVVFFVTNEFSRKIVKNLYALLSVKYSYLLAKYKDLLEIPNNREIEEIISGIAKLAGNCSCQRPAILKELKVSRPH